MSDQCELVHLFEMLHFNRLRFSKAWREYEEIQDKLFVIFEKETAAITRRNQAWPAAVKLPKFKGRKTALRNRRNVCLTIHRNALDRYGRDLQRIAEILEGRGEEWKNGVKIDDE